MRSASEPTDIIWENRNYTEGQRNFKKGVTALIVLILLAISFTIIFLCKQASLAKKNKYPKVNCQGFVDNFKGRNADWTNDAINEFRVNNELDLQGLPTHFEGVMQCFCQTEKKLGVSTKKSYQQVQGGEVVYDEPICLQYQQDQLWSKVLAQSIAFIIIGVNIVLKMIII